MSAFFTLIAYVIVPETYEPTLLAWQADKLRHETKDWALHSKSEEDPLNMNTIVNKYLMKPLHMIVKEPIVCSPLSQNPYPIPQLTTTPAHHPHFLHVTRLRHPIPDL